MSTQIAALRDAFFSAGDMQRVQKMDELARKWLQEVAVVAFSGHFSAGKSSLINSLLQRNVLPTGPLPTSANVVQFMFGELAVKARTSTGESISLANWDSDAAATLAAWCKNGEQIDAVYIATPVPYLQGLRIVDTPGIDSTDARHAQQTSDTLFLADLIVFVTDYNHVQSDLNFRFMQHLCHDGRPFLLVVNQIDKHSDFEVPFEEFEQGLAYALDEWAITPLKTYYISTVELDHEHNQFKELSGDIRRYALQNMGVNSMQQSLNQLITEHEVWLDQPKDDDVSDGSPAMTLDAAISIQQHFDSLSSKLANIDEEIKEKRVRFLDELLKICDQSIIMPYETTERAVVYIRSLSSNFKAGFLSTKAKVEVQRQQKLRAFFQDLNERIEAGIERHILSRMILACREWEVLCADAQRSPVPFVGLFTIEDAQCHVLAGAEMNDAYGYQFARSFESRVRHRYRAACQQIADHLEQALRAQKQPAQDNLQKEMDDLRDAYHQAQVVLQARRDLRDHIESLRGIVADMRADQETVSSR